MPSAYDRLHDKYHQILTSKAGTRYERLTAMVFKSLGEQDVVIHNVSLVGDSTVSHQIDVDITKNGVKRRVLIECKDYDISGDKVGLDIVRNFFAVMEDTGAGEGIIVTCNAFTSEAAKYAKAKKIKLAILREFTDEDMKGRVKTVVLKLTALWPDSPIATLNVPDQKELSALQSQLSQLSRPGGVHVDDDVSVVRGAERVHVNTFLTSHMNKAIPWGDTPDTLTVRIPADGWKLQIQKNEPINFDGWQVEFKVGRDERIRSITSDRIAELILQGFDDSDLIIFGDQLERLKIDADTGEVIK